MTSDLEYKCFLEVYIHLLVLHNSKIATFLKLRTKEILYAGLKLNLIKLQN